MFFCCQTKVWKGLCFALFVFSRGPAENGLCVFFAARLRFGKVGLLRHIPVPRKTSNG